MEPEGESHRVYEHGFRTRDRVGHSSEGGVVRAVRQQQQSRVAGGVEP